MRKAGVLSILLVVVLLAVIVEAEQAKKIPRIGFLTAQSASSVALRAEAFRHGLQELGYVEAKSIVIEWRYAEGKLNRQSELAAELARLKIDVIVSAGPTVTRAAKEATSAVPIFMCFDNDPVRSGFITSLARPSGNITGLSSLTPELSGKRLELLKEIIPTLSRLAIIGNSAEPANPQSLKEMELAARAFGMQLQYFDVRDLKDIEAAFRTATKGHAEAVLYWGALFFFLDEHRLWNLR